MAFPMLLLPRQSLSSQLPLSSLLLFLTKEMSRWNKAKFRPFRTSKHQQGSAMPEREVIAYRKGAAELKQIKDAKEEGPTQKLRWLCYAIRKDKAILLSLFFLLFTGKQRGWLHSCVCADTTLTVSGDFRGEEMIVRTASPYRMHLLISRKDIDSWLPGNSLFQCASSTHSTLLETSIAWALFLGQLWQF